MNTAATVLHFRRARLGDQSQGNQVRQVERGGWGAVVGGQLILASAL